MSPYLARRWFAGATATRAALPSVAVFFALVLISVAARDEDPRHD